MKKACLVVALILLMLPQTVLAAAKAGGTEVREIREYQGRRLSAFDRTYDNSIRGPQTVNSETYRLEVTGLVERPLSLTYNQALAFPNTERLVTLHCVEGWSETLLFEGIRLADIFSRALPRPGVQTVVFHAADGYTSSLSYGDVKRIDVMLAAKINGRVLNSRRGFPFQVVAESKYGYKWVRWVTRIELTDKPHRGYWETRGYDDKADVKK